MADTSLNILMIGHGAIASYVAEQIKDDRGLKIASALCRTGRAEEARRVLGADIQAAGSLDDITVPVSLAVDCAGHAALRQHGPAILSNGIDLLTVSNGALSDPALLESLRDAAELGNAKLRLLSGAIGAIDAIAAANVGGLESVRYTGRKPPAGWVGSPAEDRIDLSAITEPTIHFEGTARDAARLYPKNANVAATLALAGIGFDKTEARLIADPTIETNQHTIEASGAFGTLTFTIEGNGLPNTPKSSALTAMSVVKALRDYASPLIT